MILANIYLDQSENHIYPEIPEQTVWTQIRLLLYEQSDQGIHYLLFHCYILKTWSSKTNLVLKGFVWILVQVWQGVEVSKSLG